MSLLVKKKWKQATNKYYVYAYLDDNMNIYYIGKGQGDRAWSRHKVKVPTDQTKIHFIDTFMEEEDAYALPDGWFNGRIGPTDEVRRKISAKVSATTTGRKKDKKHWWITNGETNQRWPEGQPIPDKWFRGRFVGQRCSYKAKTQL